MVFDADQRLRKAVERFEEGDLPTARAMLRGLDRRGVISPRIELYLGHCHLEGDRPEAALGRYRRAASLSPKAAAPWIGLGLVHGRLGQLERAIEAFGRALLLEPASEEAHCNLVHCQALVGDLAAAERHAEAARRLDPTCAQVWRHLAVGYSMAGRWPAALLAWRSVADLEPLHPELALGRGRALAALHRVRDAQADLGRALEGEFRLEALVALAELARDAGRLEEAQGLLDQAVAVDPTAPDAALARSDLLLSRGRAAEAWAALEDLLVEWPGDPSVVAQAARVLRARGRRSSAVALLHALVESEPQDPRAWLRLGEHLLEAGRPSRAVGPLRRALRGLPAEAAPARLLARALARMGRRKAAVSVLARCACRVAGAPEVVLDLAAAQWARGRAQAGERALVRALALDPSQASVWAAAAEMALDLGQLGLARSRLRSALRRDARCPQALALLVRWLLETERPAHAAKAGRAALRVAGPGTEVLRDVAWAHLRCGQAEAARLLLRRYVLALPGDPLGYELLGQTLALLGDKAGAQQQEQLARALRGTLGMDADRRTSGAPRRANSHYRSA